MNIASFHQRISMFWKGFILLCLLVSSSGSVQIAQAAPGDTTRVSVASNGTQGNYDSYARPSISADGRYIAFESDASNLVTDDTNDTEDIFVHDRQSGQTTRVSVASNGTQGNSYSHNPSISADGRYVAFYSLASNLVSGDTNGCDDVFVHDRQSGQTTLVSVSSNGTQADFCSYGSSISADGRYIVFDTLASNLVSGDTNDTWDTFVHDRQSGQTTRVSVASNGTQGNDSSGGSFISADGRYVAFQSNASNLVSGDTNNVQDIFVHDRQTGQTTRVSVASNGTQGDSSSWDSPISADGRFIAFFSDASNLVSGDTNGCEDVFVHDRQSGQTTRVSVASNGAQGNCSSGNPSISADGRYVVFFSGASNLVSGDTNDSGDIFVHDPQSGQTTRVSVASNGTQGNARSSLPSISADGRYIAFASDASNLVSGDTNGVSDVFMHETSNTTVPVFSISGNAGTAGVTLNYIDGTSKSVISDSNGNYSISVPQGRSGTVTPSKTGYTFSPTNRVYPPIQTNQTDQDYTAILPWTVMIYLDGDNDLDPYYKNIFNQIETAANNPNVNVVVAWDRFGEPNSFYYKVKYDMNLSELASYVNGVDRWWKGEMNMGLSTTLSSFVIWARTNYPAQHYALLISDHGDGLGGIASDYWNDKNEIDQISVKELGEALSQATSNGSNKLDVVFADACYMGMIEVEYQIRKFADYYVASQEMLSLPNDVLLPHPHANYIADVTELTTPQELSVNIVAAYSGVMDQIIQPEKGYTISAVDLTKIDPLIASVKSLSSALQTQMTVPAYAIQIDTAREAAQKFSRSDYVDLTDVALEIKNRIPDFNVQAASQAVIDSVNAYVIPNGNKVEKGNTPETFSNLDKNRVHGVSIFFPSTDFRYSFYDGQNLDFAADAIWNVPQTNLLLSVTDASDSPGWGSFLVDYVSTINPSASDDPNPPELVAPHISISPMVTFIYRSDVSPTSAANVDFTVAFTEPVSGVTTDDFELYTPGITGATVTSVTPVSDAVYTVTVNIGCGNGTIRLDVVDDNTIIDAAGNPLGGVNVGDGNFTSGESYEQVITNGCFNTYPAGKKIPTNWKAVKFSTADGKTTTVKKEGTASVRIIGTGVNKTLSQTLLLNGSAGDPFTFSYWVKGSSIPTAGVCRAQILFYNGATLNPVKKTVNCGNGTYGFKQKLLSFTAPGDYTKIVVRFTYSKASGRVWFDWVSLVR